LTGPDANVDARTDYDGADGTISILICGNIVATAVNVLTALTDDPRVANLVDPTAGDRAAVARATTSEPRGASWEELQRRLQRR
jgi:hypothetical protein